jgi:hypothetical protein
MKKKFLKSSTIAILLLGALTLLVKLGGPKLLQNYIKMGIGDCKKIPVLCLLPNDEVLIPDINPDIAKHYLQYTFPKMAVRAPAGFSVVQEMIKKFYYDKKTRKNSRSIIYVLHEEKGYFPELFREAKKAGIDNNYDFIKRTMNAEPQNVKSITDAFFVIMKSIFIPDVGDQNKAIMTRFKIGKKYGFITYNLDKTGNFFNCDMTDDTGAYFKAYVKDTDAKLGINDVFAIVSTLAETGQ